MVLSETLTETIPDGTDEVDRVSLIALDGFLPYPVPAESATGEHYTEDKEAEPKRLSTIDDYSKIYCQGPILHAVQIGNVFPNDSKTFVDMKLKYTEQVIIAKYDALLATTPNPDTDTLTKFVNENFEEATELVIWSPPDLKSIPNIYYRVSDPKYRQWTLDLNQIWKELGRKVSEDVKNNPQYYSIIYVPNGLIIPGGRFRELYYWDTYWIVQGVLLSDMKQTCKGIIENIIGLVLEFGFMPNGARIYYLQRSQPPLLHAMCKSYVTFTGDFSFIKKHIKTLTIEFEYWMNNHLVSVEKDGKHYKMALYNAPSTGPRPESYREDYELVEHLKTEEEKTKMYINLKSGAMSGWDFSSRWFITKDGTNKGTLKDIKTTCIGTVDLNAFLQMNAKYLAEWYLALGNKEMSHKYKTIAAEFLETIDKVFWNEEVGCWLDYDLLNKKPRNYFYASNLTPLWTRSYKQTGAEIAKRVLEYMRANKIITEDNNVKFWGTPTSLENTTQQWDFPNAWAPYQGILIQGLDYTGDKTAQEVAKRLADKWLKTNYGGFEKFKAMFEKYDVINFGTSGAGGEYKAETGFGWSNGLIFELLFKYGKVLFYKEDEDFENENVIPDV